MKQSGREEMRVEGETEGMRGVLLRLSLGISEMRTSPQGHQQALGMRKVCGSLVFSQPNKVEHDCVYESPSVLSLESEASTRSMTRIQRPKHLSCPMLVSQAVIKELDCKWDSQDLNRHPYRIPVLQAEA